MPEDYMDESAPTQAEPMAPAAPEEKEETPDSKLALVQTSFFKTPPKPGDREMVEIVEVYDNECSIRCVYDEEEKEEPEAPAAEPGMEMGGGAPPGGGAEDMMY
jgi:hypothetical protein